jgi:hypothetical protein
METVWTTFIAAKLRTLESEKLKKTCAKAGLVKKFVNKKRTIDSLSSRNMHVVGPAFEFPGMSLHSSHEPMWIFLIKRNIFLISENFPIYYWK